MRETGARAAEMSMGRAMLLHKAQVKHDADLVRDGVGVLGRGGVTGKIVLVADGAMLESRAA
jgi:hypothetical protein